MTAAVWYRARAQLRASAAAMVVLVAVVGVGWGVVMSSTAGARRTMSAFARMLDATSSAEVLVSPNQGTGRDGFYDAIASLDEVRSVAPLRGIPLVFGEGSARAGEPVLGPVMAGFTEALATEVSRPNLLSGRMWRPGAADEIVVNRFFADDYDVEVGDRLDMAVVDFSGQRQVPVELSVVGVGVLAQEVVPFTDLDAYPSALLPPALGARLGPEFTGFEGALVDIEDGADVATVLGAIDEIAIEHERSLPEGIFTIDHASNAEQVMDSIRPLAVALGLFALVLALVVSVVLGQAVRRQLWLSPADVDSLAAIGFTRAERRLVRLVLGALLGAGSAAVAVSVAIATSAAFPLGPARLAEPDPGIRPDGAVISAGIVVVVAFCLLAALSAGDRRSRAPALAPVGSSKLSPAATAGLRAAWPTTGTGGAGALVAAVGGLLAVLAALTFGASLNALVERPERYGQSWDRMVDGQFGPSPNAAVMDEFEGDPRVEGIAVGSYGEIGVDGERVPAISWSPVKGRLEPVVVEGRHAAAPNEIALGGEVLARVDVAVGDDVEVDLGDGPRPLRVVGQVVLPRMGQGSFAATGLGFGAQLHPSALSPVEVPPDAVEALGPIFDVDGQVHNFAALAFADGLSPADVAAVDEKLDAISKLPAELGEPFAIRTAQRPTTISDLDRVRSLPAVLGAVLAGLAAATLVHSLALSLRGRRRELAIMAVLGMQRRELAATVLWHAFAVAAAAMIVATPLGVAAGRVAWAAFADGLYAAADPVLPVAAVAATVVVTLVVAGAAAVPPARRAARTHPAAALRTE